MTGRNLVQPLSRRKLLSLSLMTRWKTTKHVSCGRSKIPTSNSARTRFSWSTKSVRLLRGQWILQWYVFVVYWRFVLGPTSITLRLTASCSQCKWKYYLVQRMLVVL